MTKHESRSSFDDNTMANPRCEISTTERGFVYWLNRRFINPELREKLTGANVLLVPQEQFRGMDFPVFPVQTSDFFEFLQDHRSDQLSTDVCIADEDYKELALHADIIELVTMVVSYLIFPVITGLIANYLFQRLGSRYEDAQLRCELYVEKPNEIVKIKYDGPATTFQSMVTKLFEKNEVTKE